VPCRYGTVHAFKGERGREGLYLSMGQVKLLARYLAQLEQAQATSDKLERSCFRFASAKSRSSRWKIRLKIEKVIATMTTDRTSSLWCVVLGVLCLFFPFCVVACSVVLCAVGFSSAISEFGAFTLFDAALCCFISHLAGWHPCSACCFILCRVCV
jgi:hypothetical protein